MAPSRSRRRLLVLGSGFAAVSLLKRVNLQAYEVTVLSKRNHFLFTPLLPSTTVGTVEFRSIIEPIRRSRAGVRFVQGVAERVDVEGRVVCCRSVEDELRWKLPYDLLALCVGSDTSTLNVPGVREHALFLKELADARAIRERVVGALERACLPGVAEDERRRLLHFVAVGAGPTGVRFAAELYDLIVADLHRSYPELKGQVQITLVEAGPSILSAYDASLRTYTAQRFERQGIAVRTASAVSEVGPGFLRLKEGEVIPCGLVLWAVGFAPTALVAELPFEKDRAGRIVTDDSLQVPGHPEVFALGDCACPRDRNYPQLAQVAEQAGHYLAMRLNRLAEGKSCGPFVWQDLGISSFIGRGRAVAQGPGRSRKLAGFLAYQLWRSAMFTQLVSVRNKILVPLGRLKALVFGRDLSKF